MNLIISAIGLVGELLQMPVRDSRNLEAQGWRRII